MRSASHGAGAQMNGRRWMRGGVIGVPMTFRVLTLHFTREGVLESAGVRVVVQRDFGPYLTPDPPIHGDCPN